MTIVTNNNRNCIKQIATNTTLHAVSQQGGKSHSISAKSENPIAD